MPLISLVSPSPHDQGLTVLALEEILKPLLIVELVMSVVVAHYGNLILWYPFLSP